MRGDECPCKQCNPGVSFVDYLEMDIIEDYVKDYFTDKCYQPWEPLLLQLVCNSNFQRVDLDVLAGKAESDRS